MKLRNRLTVTLLACGLVPLAVGDLVCYLACSQNVTEIEGRAAADMERKASDHLIALRDIKKAQIEDYFKTIRDQILTFTDDRIIVDAMRDFRAPFRRYREQADIKSEQLIEMRGQLATYYTNEFSEEYKTQNNGTSPNATQYFDQLDDDSIALQHAYIRSNNHPLGSKHLLDAALDDSEYSQLHKKSTPSSAAISTNSAATTSSWSIRIRDMSSTRSSRNWTTPRP